MSDFTPADLHRFGEILSADLAPDGVTTVYAATATTDGKALGYPVLWLRSAAGEAEVLGGGTGSQSQPMFSPDGTQIAYLQDVGGVAQLSVLDLAGRGVRQLTTFARGTGGLAPRWSPDGSTIAIVACDEPVRDASRPYRITRPVWRRDGMGLVEDVKGDVWTIGVADASATRLTTHDGIVTELYWSPDGTRLLYSTFAEPASTEYFIRTIDVSSGDIATVMTGDYLVYPPSAAWLPDGRIVRTTAWDVYRALDLVVHDPATGSDTPLGVVLQGQIFGFLQGGAATALLDPRLLVDPAGRVYFPVQTGGRMEIYRVDPASPAPELVAGGDASNAPIAIAAGKLLLGRGTKTEPLGLAVADLNDDGISAPVAIPTLDRSWLDSEPYTVHELHFTGKDGVAVEGWYLEPKTGQAPYPTVMSIHGGPFGGWGHIFSADNHTMTAAGYGVLEINFRGSSGYGEDFASCLIEDWGNNDAGDLLAGIDHAIGLGLIDPDKLGSMGTSGGGWMTTWLLSHSDRFRAGIAEAPALDWNSMVASDIPQVIAQWVGAEPGTGQEALAKYARIAPSTYAAAITAPMLIIDHEADLRCPSSQGAILYNTLQIAGTETELLRLPGMFHTDASGVKDVPARVERLEAYVEWFDRHFA